MEENQGKLQNNLIFNSIKLNNKNFTQANNNINSNINNIFQSQSLNNNQLINIFHQNSTNNLNNNNYNYNKNEFKDVYQQNSSFNDIINNPISQTNNTRQNKKQSKEKVKEKKLQSKNYPKRPNYLPKNLLINQNNFQKNEYNKNKFLQNFPNEYYNFNYINQINNPENANENQSFNNNYYIQGNDIDNNFLNIITEIKNDKNKINNEIKNNKVFQLFIHIFNDKMEDVAQLLTDENFFKSTISPDIIDNIQFPKGNFKDLGNHFVFLRWKKFYNVKLKYINQYWGKKYITYTLKSVEMKPVNIGSLEIIHKYYYNTCQNNTLYITEFIIDKGILSEVFKEELFDNDLNKLCESCEKVLRQRKKEKSHISSLLINAPKENVWNNIINLNKKRYINYMNKYDLYYICKDEINNLNYNDSEKEIKENDDNKNYHIQKGDFILIKKNENLIFSKLIIDDIIEGKDKNELVLICNKAENQPKKENNNDEENKLDNTNNKNNIQVLNQKIIINIREIAKDMCYLEYIHIWEDYVNGYKLNTLDLLKNNSLKKIKEFFTEDDNPNSKNMKKSDNSTISIFNLLCPIEL